METLMLPFSPRFIVLTICAVVTALLLGIGIFDHNPKALDIVLVPEDRKHQALFAMLGILQNFSVAAVTAY